MDKEDSEILLVAGTLIVLWVGGVYYYKNKKKNESKESNERMEETYPRKAITEDVPIGISPKAAYIQHQEKPGEVYHYEHNPKNPISSFEYIPRSAYTKAPVKKSAIPSAEAKIENSGTEEKKTNVQIGNLTLEEGQFKQDFEKAFEYAKTQPLNNTSADLENLKKAVDEGRFFYYGPYQQRQDVNISSMNETEQEKFWQVYKNVMDNYTNWLNRTHKLPTPNEVYKEENNIPVHKNKKKNNN